ncbi:very-long-chain (3R)-3-hydroxyacyl-CoA dehydratase isoform X3 [Oncorhynchus tshawytscha]|uniref:very-long-chain (3R)-3-hydroxyacyl-CoA dehydratase isoform X2 n=1 Tax=Oncorhynchus tshawytscha TaxID=74940 RepID=UPI001C3E34C7|nr:very-long-chain (3R)-3-hydroxyacyl-CoA dehydratase isoform X2 [Oncorhynchus tshawytscha]XP_042151735.1 very-long-chain (3R)-3-hydroxyacyl-CoA dehydratase isoform X3 [Oncorhynchus tshawytscha]
MQQTLTPHVYWAQRHEDIYLRVELIDAQNLDISVHDNVLQFRAQGHGARGHNDYEFSLPFLNAVKTEVSHRSTQRQVNITVRKQLSGWWDRLTLQEKKPLFLAPDFDRWMDESDAEMELREKEKKKNRLNMESRLSEDSYITLKKAFLFTYNLVQFLGFSWIFVNMTIRLFILGQDSLYDTFYTISDVMFFCQILASVEVLNAMFGVVKAAVVPAFIQVIGRNFILFIILGSLQEMHNKPVVFFVFYLWSAIEIFRYPFYMLGCIDTEWKTITWLRYTVWIPLYPLGVLAEVVAVVQSISVFDQSRLFSIPLPEALGSSASFSCVLYIYLPLMVIGLLINFRHLYKQRRKRFRTKKRKSN